MIRRRDGNKLDRPDDDPLQLVVAEKQRAADAEHGAAIQHQARHRPQSLYRQAQRHGRKFLAEGAQEFREPCRRDHDIDGEADLGFEAVEHALDLGAQAVDALGDAAGLGHNRASRFREARLLGSLPIEQGDAKLRLQIGDAIADDRNRAVELAPGAGETAGFHDGEKNLQLIQGRDAGA